MQLVHQSVEGDETVDLNVAQRTRLVLGLLERGRQRDVLDDLVPRSVVKVAYLLFAALHGGAVVDLVALLAGVEVLRDGLEVFAVLRRPRF